VREVAYIAQYYTQNFTKIQKTCLVDSDLPQLKEMPSGRVDIRSLEQFLTGIDAMTLDTQGSHSQPPRHAPQENRFNLQLKRPA